MKAYYVAEMKVVGGCTLMGCACPFRTREEAERHAAGIAEHTRTFRGHVIEAEVPIENEGRVCFGIDEWRERSDGWA